MTAFSITRVPSVWVVSPLGNGARIVAAPAIPATPVITAGPKATLQEN